MTLSYRTRRRLQNLGIFLAILVLLLVIAWIVWLLWLDRYVVYSRSGAKLDFNASSEQLSGQLASPPDTDATIDIYYNEGDNTLDTSTELTQLAGYYADTKALREDIDFVFEQVRSLAPGTPILLDMKDIAGRFHYDTALSSHISSAVDQDAMSQLLAYLRTGDYYLIARVPAFQDYYFGLENVPYGLPTSKGYLWFSEDRTYWLNPASEGTMTYLIQIATELRSMGFDEVVFTDFCFPNTDKIVFKGNKTDALFTAAQRLVDACSTERFAVSFATTNAGFALPEGRTRLYLEDQAAADAAGLAMQTGIADTAVNLVFLTEVNDTRFDVFGVLRPISSAVGATQN